MARQLFIGLSFFFLIWTFLELKLIGIIDLPGDAQFYYQIASEGSYFDNFYPIYTLFISYLGLNNPHLVRFIQFIFLLLLFQFIYKWKIKSEEIDGNRRLFLIFFVTNFGIYLLVVQMIRDWMIFFSSALMIVLLSEFNLKTKRLLFIILLCIFSYSISGFLLFLIVFSFGLSLILQNFFRKFRFKSIVLISLASVALYYIFRDYLLIFFKNIDFVLETQILRDSSARSNILVAFFNFLFGPGLIRPLFPSIYYQVYTGYFATLTWVACLSWYLHFSISVSLLYYFRSSLNLSRNFLFFLILFMSYVLTYAITFGGPGGLRKRMLAYFLFHITVFELLKFCPIKLNKNIILFSLSLFFTISISTALISL